MLVKKWEMEIKDFKLQQPRKTTYSTCVVDGELMVQIQTYNADCTGGSPKQIMQFDKQRAEELIDILKKTFAIND